MQALPDGWLRCEPRQEEAAGAGAGAELYQGTDGAGWDPGEAQSREEKQRYQEGDKLVGMRSK